MRKVVNVLLGLLILLSCASLNFAQQRGGMGIPVPVAHQVYPTAGIAVSTGQTWTTSLQLTTFTNTTAGLCPASGGGTTKFLRSDGTWTAPTGGGGGGFSSQNVVTSSRAFGSVYQNTTGKTMFVVVSGICSSNGYMVVYTDGSNPPTTVISQQYITSGTTDYIAASFMVLSGNYYKVSMSTGTGTLYTWVEYY